MGVLDKPFLVISKVLISTLGGTLKLIRPAHFDGGYTEWNVDATPLEEKQGDNLYQSLGSRLPKGDVRTSMAAQYLADNRIPIPQVGFRLLQDGG
jgi:hypothetical protein